MRFVSTHQMRLLDQQASERFSIPSLILMENAGRAVADEVERLFSGRGLTLAIFCGYGNNGGDGLVAARHLYLRGHRVCIYLVGRHKTMSVETRRNFKIIRQLHIACQSIKTSKDIITLQPEFKKVRGIIDAIFGIGIKGRLDTFYCQLFTMINQLHKPIISIDIASGLNADTGKPLPIAVKATTTVTLGLAKKGFRLPSARHFLGKLIVADISLPRQISGRKK